MGSALTKQSLDFNGRGLVVGTAVPAVVPSVFEVWDTTEWTVYVQLYLSFVQLMSLISNTWMTDRDRETEGERHRSFQGGFAASNRLPRQRRRAAC